MYILDEPSIGLHPRDTKQLIEVLRRLKQIGNTVLVVEHDEEIMRASDQVIDIGPRAGREGGEVVFQGDHSLLEKSNSLTARYLTGKEKIAVPGFRRKWNNYIEITGARENNLKNLRVKFPLNVITVVTGVSGSGKSSLVTRILYPALSKMKNGTGEEHTGHHDAILGDTHLLTGIEMVDQNPIGKSSRSNPVTYIKAYDEIRKLFADQQSAKYLGLEPAHFSFNVDGGRCPECQGEGIIKVEMQFLADVYLVCESCGGKRFKEEILEVRYREHNIDDILNLTVEQAIALFSIENAATEKRIVKRLQPLQEVGLGYIKLGQSSSTLSGGESQRVKLASFLAREKDSPTLFVFDEPTTGLHFHDIRKLLDCFAALMERGHTIVIIEHNLEIIKTADWIIDLGPEGGEKGGYIVFEGTPEELIMVEHSYTGKALGEKLRNSG